MNDFLATVPLTQIFDRDALAQLALHSCLDIHRVHWLRSYLAVDGKQMLCWYQARDAESVRLVLRQQDTSRALIWAAEVSNTTAQESLAEEGARIVVELQSHGRNGEDLASAGKSAIAALEAEGYMLSGNFMGSDGSRLVLIVGGGDRAAVTHCLQSAAIETAKAWPCIEIDPQPPRLFEAARASPARPVESSGIDADTRTSEETVAEQQVSRQASTEVDALIIGAGIAGICTLQRFLQMGLRVRLCESASDAGGVWHWNRYPGARVDSETYSYGFSFSDELIRDWDWTELFSSQSEIEHYLHQVVKRFDLRRHMDFETRIAAATFDNGALRWLIETEAGNRITAQYLIAATGALSIPQLPDYAGIEDFAGASHHTARWPETAVDLKGKRVGVVGTGASGVQVIQSIAADVEHLSVFQRTPTYCIPRRNRMLSQADQQGIRRNWDSILAACRESFGGFIHNFDPRSGLAVSVDERQEKFEALWQKPGFAFWFGNFADLMMNMEVNTYASDFVREKIRARVNDPDLARKLIPSHPLGTKRIPLEDGYYEIYNQSNVRLVDLRETPVQRITPAGIRTAQEEHQLDVLIYATGFDAATGALTRIDLRGQGDLTLSKKWQEGARTFLGLMVNGFPNLFIVNGPHNAAALCNASRCIEQNVDWIAECIEYMRTRGLRCIEPSLAAENEWTEHVCAVAEASVLGHMKDSWFFGANTPGKARQVTIYAAGAREYRQHCEDVARAEYPGCAMW